ncbi:MAG TPA: SCO family protein [Ktedonobacterales bacterium]|jgi:cytochrome oxidase Cu insertion factor (SCO1/SenC/PrrC family)
MSRIGPFSLRTISRLMVIVLVVVLGVAIGLHNVLAGRGAPPAPKLVAGTTLDGHAAPSFALVDQTGTTVSLARLRGHPVVITFLDATCVTECPLTAQYLDWTAQFLGPRAHDVVWLAVSVNPSNTPAQAQAFITKNHVAVPLHVLLGTPAQLSAVWHAYYIDVVPSTTGDVEHTIATYLIDPAGHEREILDQAYDAKLAAQDLRALGAA